VSNTDSLHNVLRPGSAIGLKVKWSLQINEGHLKVKVIAMSLQRSRVILRSKGHFRSMKVI
jgi:hypothetical protein